MPNIRRSILSHSWLHSHEEDSAKNTVFRPTGYEFPPSRGRRGFDLRAGGELVQIGIGPTDRPTQSSGTWKLEGDRLILHTSPGSQQEQMYKILKVTSDELV